jgi:hypothetical protein
VCETAEEVPVLCLRVLYGRCLVEFGERTRAAASRTVPGGPLARLAEVSEPVGESGLVDVVEGVLDLIVQGIGKRGRMSAGKTSCDQVRNSIGRPAGFAGGLPGAGIGWRQLVGGTGRGWKEARRPSVMVTAFSLPLRARGAS